ncbi:DNA repair protein RecO [Roseibium denhamense]|uniref:DNA repair protein RecO n=1 Tax=Roseibium denhamense TaxID=76305 RepID=A0ABY1NWJ1_9HYPH|nr:DNA repair protein RecO [Roseibium denhamense]MTI04789.1 DNA repair protein RecO [Roseibium denhamense]SMP19355.1 DNA replication and repair protein RecO [Roseibium denhamense]
MEWTGRGVVLTTRKHGEADVILEVMSEDHGRHLGLVRGGRSKRQRPILQPGNELFLTWKARLSDHLGQFQIEPSNLRAGDLMLSGIGLAGLQHLAVLLRMMPERHPYPRLFGALEVVLNHITEPDTSAALLIRFELEVLRDLGAGLDFQSCAATGTQDDLAYVSPRSARAVSRDAGAPYHDKLLPLPSFLLPGQRQAGSELTWKDVDEGFRLTGFFLDRYSQEHGKPSGADTRSQLCAALQKEYRDAFPWNFA